MKDTIYGQGGPDLLEGGGGVDALYGGDGDDELHGGVGGGADNQNDPGGNTLDGGSPSNTPGDFCSRGPVGARDIRFRCERP